MTSPVTSRRVEDVLSNAPMVDNQTPEDDTRENNSERVILERTREPPRKDIPTRQHRGTRTTPSEGISRDRKPEIGQQSSRSHTVNTSSSEASVTSPEDHHPSIEMQGWMEMRVLHFWKVFENLLPDLSDAFLLLQRRFFYLHNSKLHYYKKEFKKKAIDY